MAIRNFDTGKISTELSHHGFRRAGDYGFNFHAPLQQNLSFFLEGQPYRLADGRILMVHRGTIDLELDLEEYHLEPGDIALAIPGSLAIVNRLGCDCVVSLVTFTQMPTGEGRQECFMARCDEGTQLRIEKYIDLITLQAKRGDAPTDIVARLFDSLILDVQSLSGRVKHPIDLYADRLCVTAGYVSTMVKRHSGMTALQWIDRALVREAKVLLHHTQMPVAEVAETLGFATPSFFIRFFRQQTGITPLQFRKRV